MRRAWDVHNFPKIFERSAPRRLRRPARHIIRLRATPPETSATDAASWREVQAELALEGPEIEFRGVSSASARSEAAWNLPTRGGGRRLCRAEGGVCRPLGEGSIPECIRRGVYPVYWCPAAARSHLHRILSQKARDGSVGRDDTYGSHLCLQSRRDGGRRHGPAVGEKSGHGSRRSGDIASALGAGNGSVRRRGRVGHGER